MFRTCLDLTLTPVFSGGAMSHRFFRSPCLFRLLPLLGLLLAGGCASSGRPANDLMDRPRIRTVTAGSLSPSGENTGAGTTTIRYEEDPVVIRDDFPATRREVWRALLRAFEEEDLIPDGMDPEEGLLSLSRFQWSGERGGVPLSLLFDCGVAPSGRPLADAAEIVGSIVSLATEEGEGSRVSLRVDAWARPFGASGGRARGCTTTGRLEQDLLARIRMATASGTPSAGTPPLADSSETGASRPGTGTPTPARGGISSGMNAFRGHQALTPGDQVRLRLSPTVRLTGTFLGLRGDSLVLRRTRSSSIPLDAVTSLEVQRVRRGYTLGGALVGVATGVALAVTTDLGISGRQEAQGRILNPGLGAIAGGLVGAGLAHVFLGTSWESLSLDQAAPMGGGGPGVRASGASVRLQIRLSLVAQR